MSIFAVETNKNIVFITFNILADYNGRKLTHNFIMVGE